ncbi:MAG: deoxyguanosinetriphosphate triphosphohydrolase [Proteobacteria bacterium]|nr:deoxyguanosinetriphosphate triphosphohydrolase [Pseudomonadota bacterium]
MAGALQAESKPPTAPTDSGRRAIFACFPQASRGRRVPEPESALRSAFQRDRDRVIHSTAFRRLKHKTQVFVSHESDHYRTRLTHSLEVAQIARTLARALALDEDLAECVALAHDLGHTCFGHAGEEALHAAMAPYGGFDHNAQTLRVLTKLECRHVGFDGLNLTWESLEGVVKHNGPLSPPLPAAIVEYVAGHDLELGTHPGMEAQVAAIADDIAYNAHDLDDGLRAGLFAVEDLAGVPLVGPTYAAIRAEHPAIEPARAVGELVRRLVGAMVGDALAETQARLAEANPASADAVRRLGHPVVAFSVPFGHQMAAIKGFLFERMYRHHTVNAMTSRARRVVRALFDLYLAEPNLLPPEWQRRAAAADKPRLARAVADYIAGMTDNFALQEYRRLFEVEA